MHLRRILIACALLALHPTAAICQNCPSLGLNLGIDAQRMGDAFAITVSGGPPQASGYLGLDTGPGPINLGGINLCLDLSPSLILIPFSLDALGAWGFSGLLPLDASLAGVSVYAQAAAIDASQVSGVAVSNGSELEFRAPSLLLLSFGSFSPPILSPGRLEIMECINHTVTQSSTVNGVITDYDRARTLGRLYALTNQGSIEGWDTATAQSVGSAAIPGNSNAGGRVRVTPDEQYLMVLLIASSFANTPTRFLSIDLSSMSVVQNIDLSGLSVSQTQKPIPVPNSSIVFLPIQGSDDLLPLDYLTGVFGAPVGITSDPQVTMFRHAIRDNRLIAYAGGGVQGLIVAVFDLLTLGNTLTLPLPHGSFIAQEPGLVGDSVWFWLSNSGTTQFTEIDLSAGAVLPTLSVPMRTQSWATSTGGTEYLLVDTGIRPGPFGSPGTPGSLASLSPAGTLSAPIPLPAERQNGIVALPSDTLRRAYFHNELQSVFMVSTDPLTNFSLVYTAPTQATIRDIIVLD